MARITGGITLTRGGLGQAGSVIGSVGLVSGLLGLLWQGGFTPAIGLLLAAGAGGLALWATLLPEDARAFLRGRQVRYSTLSIFSTLLLVGIVGLTYILVQRQVIVADMTVDSRFTLSPETMTVLQTALRSPQKIEITGFYYAYQVLQREIDDGYFQLYESLTGGHIYRRYINPTEEPGFSAAYMDFIAQGYNVFLSFVNDDGTLRQETTIPLAITGRQEADITKGLRQLLVSGAFVVYFDTGLGEPDPLSNLQQDLSILNNYLRTNGLVTQSLDVAALAAAGGSIPADASAVMIVQPRRDMTAAEVAVLDAYLRRGGSLFIAADVFFTEDLFLKDGGPLNEYLWQYYGLRLRQEVVVDPTASGQTPLDPISAAVFGNNQIGQNLNIAGQPQTATQFRLARAIELNENPPVTNGSIIMTSPEAWGETDWQALSQLNAFSFDPAADRRGPLTTAAWAFDEATGAKVVLVGDGDFVTNGFIISPQGNAVLALDSLGWMTGYTEAVEFQPAALLTTPVLFVDSQTLDLIGFLTVILLPGAMLALAAAIYARRLRQ